MSDYYLKILTKNTCPNFKILEDELYHLVFDTYRDKSDFSI